VDLPERVDNLRQRVSDPAGVIGAPSSLLPTYVHSDDMARPHIEWEGNQLHLAVRERGSEISRKWTTDVDEMLYWIFDGVTSEMASKWAAQQRIEGHDFRIPWFRRRLELMGSLSGRWAARFREENSHRLSALGLL
jgi:Immunity protein 63